MRYWIGILGSAFVNGSASWCLELVWLWTSLRKLEQTYSRIKSLSKLICLERSWQMGLVASWMPLWLSQNTMLESTITSKSLSNCLSHSNSDVRAAMALYSASAEERATIVYFFGFQAIKKYPISGCGFLRNLAASPISVHIGGNYKKLGSWKKNDLTGSTF